MDISNSSDDEESVIMNNKTSFKVGLLSRMYEIILFFILSQKTEKSVVEDVEEISDASVEHSNKKEKAKKTINNKPVIIIIPIILPVTKSILLF
jgi:hypothetical protein